MGWSSGTRLFDTALDLMLEYVPEPEKARVVEEWYLVFANEDWDTEDESKYFYPYIIEAMHKYAYLDDETYLYYRRVYESSGPD